MDPLAFLLLLLATGFNLALGLGVLLVGTRERLGWLRVGSALAAVTAVVLGQVACVTFVLRDMFLAIHFVYLDTFVVMPSCALALLVLRRGVGAMGVQGLAWAGLLAVPIGIYASFIEPSMLVTESVSVELERHIGDELRIAVLADLQFAEPSEHERQAVRLAMEFEPHLILLPGDLQQVGWEGYMDRADEVRELLAPLEAPLGVFLVPGNVEPRSDRVRELLSGTAVRYLDNEIVHLSESGVDLRIYGVDLRFSGPQARAVLSALEDDPGDDVRLLLAHRPDVVFALPGDTRADLIVAGHTHGGQVNLPFIGPPITLSAVSRDVAAGGLHVVDGKRLYVSRGVGCERMNAPRVRFNARPEVTWIKLEAASRLRER